jgi:hypothetical protein
MPAIALTAAEIAAAEAAAIAAAEAAAIQAAQVAAAEAAAQAAATAAAEQAAAQAATQAATQQATTSGIQTLAQEVATTTPPTGIDQLTQAFQNAQVNNVPMSQAEFLNQSFAGPAVNTGSQLSPLVPGLPSPIPVAPPAVPNAVVPDPMTYFDPAQPFANATFPSAPPAVPTMTPPAPPAPPVGAVSASAPPVDYGFSSGLKQGVNAPLNTAQPSQYALGNQAGNYNLAGSVPSPAATATANPEPSGIGSLFDKGLDYAKKNPLTTLMGANTLGNYLNKPEPYEKEKYKSTFKPGLYSGYTPVQPTPYQPQYAGGGLADLGGYSDGGRMLKGPGDGMSDDIPATIANKQPARLANEEFVIPADVVSHLGNGSSEAGAKQLYKMMDRVRQARTGNKKQGKQINPEKYLA